MLSITGLTKDEISKILSHYCLKGSNGTVLDFERILPTPRELLNAQSPCRKSDEQKAELIKKYGADDWYDWRIKNWGVKWPPSFNSANLEITDDAMVFFFDTPWGPPVNIIKFMSSLFPNATFQLQFAEPGMNFSGEDIFQAGRLTDSHDDPSGDIMRQIYGEPVEDEDDN